MKNLSEIVNDVGVLVQRSEDSDYLTKIKVWINLSHKLLSEIYDYWIDLKDRYSFSTVDGTENYGLPTRFDKPLRLYNLTSKKKIVWITEEEYSDGNISNLVDLTEGNPSYARLFGSQGSLVSIPSSGSTVQVKSSSLSDSGGIKIRINGYIDSNLLVEDFEDIVINTASPISYVSGTKTFYKILHISKASNTVGYVTVADSLGTVLEYLAPIERISRHKILKLGLIPDSAYSMLLLFKKTVGELVNDYDYPFTECDRYLTFDALGWALKQDKDDQRAELAWGRAAEALKILLTNQNSKLGPDYQNKILSVWLSAHRNR